MRKNLAIVLINKLLAAPQIWELSQFIFGSNLNKQYLYRSLFTSTGKLLDFGCADGNTFPAFKEFDYYGIDLNSKFIAYARNKYRRYANAHWLTANIISHPFEEGFFDYVLFAETGHHIPDDNLYLILQSLINLVKKRGRIYLIDHISRPDKDNWWIKLLIKFDQGQYTRTTEQYTAILDQFRDQIVLISSSTKAARGNFFPLPDFYIAILERK